MAFSTLTINFTSIPNENEVINISESTNGLNLNQIFKVARYGSGNTEIPEYDDLLDRYIGYISTYYKQAFDLDYNASSLFTVVATNGTLYSGLGSVTITANYDNAVFAVSLNNTDAEITFTNHYVAPTIPDPIIPVVLPDATILSRSPYNVAVTPTVLFDQIIMNLYLYKGHKTTDKPILPNYTLSKIVVYAGQPKIAIEISKIVNDFIKNNYTPTLGGGSNTTSSKDSTWIYAEMTMKYLGEPVYYINQTLHALDGFGYHTELANPTINTNVLSSITKHTFYNGRT
jgi:hypothetical protein